MDREELIELKKEQIRLLEQEIKLLSGNNIRSCALNSIIYGVWYEEDKDGGQKFTFDVRDTACHPVWELIRGASMKLFMENDKKYRPDRNVIKDGLKQRDLTHEQILLCGKFCDEVIDIYNKYIKLANPTMTFCGKTLNPWEGYSEQLKE